MALAGSLAALILLPRLVKVPDDTNLFVLAPIQVVLGGTRCFLASLTCIVVVFARLGLYDRSKALALPEGSIRALIALVLLIIFVIFANIVFGSLSTRRANP